MNTEPNDKQSDNTEAGQLRQAVVVPSATPHCTWCAMAAEAKATPVMVFRQEGDDGHLDGYDADEWCDVEDDDEVIIGYECLGCGNTQATDGWGGRCDRCDGLSLEAMYY